jgi:hypothetical protein
MDLAEIASSPALARRPVSLLNFYIPRRVNCQKEPCGLCGKWDRCPGVPDGRYGVLPCKDKKYKYVNK